MPMRVAAGRTNPSALLTERDYYIDAEGNVYALSSVRPELPGGRIVISDEGSGMPPIEYITQRGPFQHGESIKDYFLRPRVVQYLIRQNFCSRQAAYDGRTALLNAIRPNKTGGPTGTLRKILPGGAKRDLTVVPLEGPRFEPSQLGRWDEWSIQEVLRFMAHNPVYFDPTDKTFTLPHPSYNEFPYTFPFQFASEEELVYPITYPIQYEHFDNAQVLEYQGNWEEFPTIVISGPARDRILIENETTGLKLEFSYANGFRFLGIGEEVTITLTPSTKTVESDNDSVTISMLTEDSDLGEFNIVPGDNTLRALIYGAGAATQVAFQYHDRYIGY